MEKTFVVYILASSRNGTLYIGSTKNLTRRVWEHKNDLVKGFTSKYSVHKLVYFEVLDNAMGMISRERQLKKWKRDWKIQLIEKNNPEWEDLYNEIL